MKSILSFAIFFCPFLAIAQLTVTVSPPRTTGSKAVVKLGIKNNFTEKIESARAVCFLADDQGKVIGHATQWVIGGTKSQPPLDAKGGTTYNFVITGKGPLAVSNLTARVSFTRVVLDGGRLADTARDVQITSK